MITNFVDHCNILSKGTDSAMMFFIFKAFNCFPPVSPKIIGAIENKKSLN